MHKIDPVAIHDTDGIIGGDEAVNFGLESHIGLLKTVTLTFQLAQANIDVAPILRTGAENEHRQNRYESQKVPHSQMSLRL